jgi:hypothetical protein
MSANKNILVPVEDSAASDRAVTYVTQMIAGRKDFQVVLFHMPASMLRQLREFRGAEHPTHEQRGEAELSAARTAWAA